MPACRLFFVKLVYDLTPADDTLCWTCLQERVACVALCYTDQHAELLFDRLVNRMKTAMSEAGNPLYSPSYALAVGLKPKEATATKTSQDVPKKPKRKPPTTTPDNETAQPAKPKGGKKSQQEKKPKEEDGDESDGGANDGASSDVWDPLSEP